MFGKSVSFLLLILLSYFSFAQQIRKGKTTLDFRFNGKVKSVEINTEDPRKSDMKIPPKKEIYEFSEKGRATYYYSSELNNRTEIFYDTVGYATKKIINGKEFRFINSYTLGALMKVEYDSIIGDDDFLPFWMFGYNGSWDLAFETHYNDERNMVFNYKHVYDKIGRVIAITRVCCDENHEFYTKLVGEKYEYDARYNITKKSIFHEDFGKTETHFMEYNSRNRVTKDSITIKFNSSYPVKPKKRSHENLSRVKTYAYNEQMDPITVTCQTIYDKKPLIYSYKYEYDSLNNWTKREKALEEQVVEITTRKITYY